MAQTKIGRQYRRHDFMWAIFVFAWFHSNDTTAHTFSRHGPLRAQSLQHKSLSSGFLFLTVAIPGRRFLQATFQIAIFHTGDSTAQKFQGIIVNCLFRFAGKTKSSRHLDILQVSFRWTLVWFWCVALPEVRTIVFTWFAWTFIFMWY